ncbi:hypothetical protein [Stieleria mannarensis]|uniref:hypothetical protein n=1 Tax=Stieleria mannarensis TaxID=2755585 RepID=UPI0025702D09|nr:hypothetical protein [Rhodopirellula sp. JC639]
MHRRRDFISSVALGGLFASLPSEELDGAENTKQNAGEFIQLTKNLLVDWCDGMIAYQIDAPDAPTRHGGLACPACPRIHGRCSDAPYPFLHLADVTGQQKYLDAATKVYDWAEHNVSRPDGSWTNDTLTRNRGVTPPSSAPSRWPKHCTTTATRLTSDAATPGRRGWIEPSVDTSCVISRRSTLPT